MLCLRLDPQCRGTVRADGCTELSMVHQFLKLNHGADIGPYLPSST